MLISSLILTYRILSAWFYRGHNPNLDFFQVRPEFKEIAEGKRPRVLFPEYIEMPEYQNIQTRMLGADSFPYRNITINEGVRYMHLIPFSYCQIWFSLPAYISI